MFDRRVASSTLFLLLLAACGGGGTGSNGSDGVDKQVEPVRQQSVPENLVDDQRNEAVPLEPPPGAGR